MFLPVAHPPELHTRCTAATSCPLYIAETEPVTAELHPKANSLNAAGLAQANLTELDPTKKGEQISKKVDREVFKSL